MQGRSCGQVREASNNRVVLQAAPEPKIRLPSLLSQGRQGTGSTCFPIDLVRDQRTLKLWAERCVQRIVIKPQPF